MAMASGIYGPFIRDSLNNVKAFDLDADTIKWQTTSDTYTPDFDTHDEEADLTNEVTGTGYTTGGEALASVTSAIASGVYTFDAADISLATTTLASVEGVIVMDDTLTGDPLIVAVDFGSPVSTTAGTFAVTWNASGIFTIDYTP